MNWTLLVVAVTIILFALIGLKKGIIGMIFSLASIVIVIAVTILIAPGLTTYIQKNTNWSDSIRSKTESYYEDKGVLKYSDDNIDTVDEIPLPEGLKTAISDKSGEYLDKGYEAYNNFIIDSTTDIIFSAIVYVTLFMLIYLLLGIIRVVVCSVGNLPVIRQVNKLAGFIAGLAMGILVVWVGAVLITIFSNFSFTEVVFNNINSSKVLTFLYNNNFVLKMILDIFS